MGAQNFNFVPKFSPKCGFLVPNFVFLEKNFDKKKFSVRLKFRQGMLHVTTPLSASLATVSLYPVSVWLEECKIICFKYAFLLVS